MIGGAIDFDGTGDYITYELDPLVNSTTTGTNPFSISLWIYPRSVSGWDPYIGTFDVSYNPGWYIGQYAAETLAVNFGADASQDLLRGYINADSDASLNEWSHVVIIYDGCSGGGGTVFTTSNCGELWLNGVKVDDEDITDVASSNGFSGLVNMYGLRIGGMIGQTRSVDAIIDEIGIFDTNLTASEIAELWNGGAGSQPVTEVLEIVNSSFNLTSDGGCVDFPCYTTDSTPTLTFNTTLTANCSFRNQSHSFDSDFLCSTSNSTTHICTIYSNDTLVYGLNDAFVSCWDGITEVNSSVLEINYSGTLFSVSSVFTPLDSDGNSVINFSSDNLEEIEKVKFNFTFNTTIELGSWYLNFSDGGLNGCSLGNKQSTLCYNYFNSSYQWIQFINGSETSTFDGTTGNQGDKIDVISANGSEIILTVDEHYQSVFKWYDALYNWTNITWLNGSQALTKNQIIRASMNSDLIPLDADQYKLDFRVTYSTPAPTEAIQAFLCNSSYSVGLPSGSSNCALVATKTVSELQDDGTKFRGIFTKNLIDEIYNIDYVVLETEISNPTRYFNLKTYEATNDSHPIKWEWSDNAGLTWTNGTDSEVEININWFFDGAQPSKIFTGLYVQSVEGVDYVLNSAFEWDINATNNYPPLIIILSPNPSESVTLPYNITFQASDPNDDNLTVSIYLYDGGSLEENITSSLIGNDTIFLFNWTNVSGVYDLVIEACENETTELLCHNDTHSSVSFSQPANDTLSCYYQDSPYYDRKGFYALCYSSLNNMSCYGTLDYDGRIVQISPERKVLQNNEVSSFFVSDTGSVNIKFSNDNLKTGVPVNMTIYCTDGSETLFFAREITPEIRRVLDINTGLAYLVSNAFYLVGALLVLLGIFMFLGGFIRNR